MNILLNVLSFFYQVINFNKSHEKKKYIFLMTMTSLVSLKKANLHVLEILDAVFIQINLLFFTPHFNPSYKIKKSKYKGVLNNN